MGTIGEYALHRELPGLPGEAWYEATHVVLPRRARLAVARDREAAVRVMREACLLEALRHPGVPRVYDCGQLAPNRPWVAAELVTGEPLPTILPAPELAATIRDVATILAHAHRRGVIHDAIWLDAIVRDPDRGFPVCVTGWSRARCATPADGAIDIRALGLAMYAAMPLQPPPQLARLVEDMLAPDPSDRPTADELHREAGRIAALPTTAEYGAVEEVELVIDLSRELPTPEPAITRPRWTPPHGVEPPPPASGVTIARLKRRP